MVFETGFQFVEHHERIDAGGIGMGDQGVGDLVLHIAGRDADHALRWSSPPAVP